jgi:hypothetical protein
MFPCTTLILSCPMFPSPILFTPVLLLHLPPPGEDRTSPEGSSHGEADQGREESEQLDGEAHDRLEDKEDTACNVTNVEDDVESLYAKVDLLLKETNTST